MKSFWLSLPRPFTVLAPMEGVTDVVFREIIREIGRPDVFFTEFVNVEGLNSSGFEKVSESLDFKLKQKPIIAQLWGKEPEDFKQSAKLCKRMDFSGIDINMGCPDRVIVNRGSCAALIKNSLLAREIIESTKDGAGGLPVSVKTRLGFDRVNLDWISFLLEQNLDAITIHLRTVLELSNFPAHWEVMSEIIKLKNELSPKTLIIGNGDIQSLEEINEKYNTFSADGFMIGRGIFQNPWFFNKKVDIQKVTVKTRIDLYLRHINLFNKTWPNKNFAFLKKFCKTYINNFSDAAGLRDKINESTSIFQMIEILKNYKYI